MTGSLLSDADRELLRGSFRRFLQAQWGVPRTPLACTAAQGESLMREIAGLGLFDLGPGRDSGGAAELFVAAEELGRAACAVDLTASFLLNELADRSSNDSDEGARGWLRSMREGVVRPVLTASEAALQADRDTLRGSVIGVEIFPGSTHVAIVAASLRRLFVVPLAQPGVRLQAQSAMGGIELQSIHLEAAAIDAWLALDEPAMFDAASLARGSLCARSLGAARRAFELARQYAVDRRQFGKPIGAFQAVQHRLANCHIAIEGIAELLSFAAALRDAGRSEWRFYADSAFAHASDALPRCMLDVQHTFGAIGYAQEHESPRHFRRVHWDMLSGGGRAAACAAVAAHILRAGGMPDRPLDPDAQAFRGEVRRWLADHWTDARQQAQAARPFHLRDRDPQFAKCVGAEGWASLTWPSRFGGMERPVTHQLVLAEEMERNGAPRFGAPIHAAAIMAFGSDAQQAEHLRRIAQGDGIYGIAYSEPDAGSDLASLRTSATRTDEGWVIRGQKIWMTTYWGGHMWVLARTDAAASPPHAGLSLFLMPTDTPGVSIVPADTMYDGKFANVFFDDVKLPPEALLGEVNDAWRILTLALSVERAVIGGGILGRLLQSFDELVRWARQTGPEAAAGLIGAFGARIAVGQALAQRSANAVDEARAGLVEAAVCKVFCSELMEDFFEAALQLGGPTWALSEGASDAVFGGRFEQRLRHSLMHVISGGTNDIQRNLIAYRGLGLPRH